MRNKTYDDHISGRPFAEIKADFDVAVANKDVSRIITWSGTTLRLALDMCLIPSPGTSVGSVARIMPAEEVVHEFERDIAATIGRLHGLTQ